MNASQKWCLVRWMSGYTQAVLRARRDGHGLGTDPVTGASFCGPLSLCGPFEGNLPGSYLGFPRDQRKFQLFESEAEAAQWVESKGDWISIDTPTPIEALHFWAAEHSSWDGVTRVIYDRGDLQGARAALALRMLDTEGDPGSNYLRHSIECHPLWERLGRHRPTIEQARAMFAVSQRLDEQRTAAE